MKKFPLTTEDKIARLERHIALSVDVIAALVELLAWAEDYKDPVGREFVKKTAGGEIKNRTESVKVMRDNIAKLKV